MAKRKMLQWMRERLQSHAEKIVQPAAEKKALEAAYSKALPLARALFQKKYPPADMRVLLKYKTAHPQGSIKMQFPNGVVTHFLFYSDDQPIAPDVNRYDEIFLADAALASAVEKFQAASEAYVAERKRRLAAYRALTLGASYVEDVIEVWPEASGVLPVDSLPIPLGPEQIALVKADQRERKAA